MNNETENVKKKTERALVNCISYELSKAPSKLYEVLLLTLIHNHVK